MIIDTENLIKVSTYAKNEGIGNAAAYKRIKKRGIPVVCIDKTMFINKETTKTIPSYFMQEGYAEKSKKLGEENDKRIGKSLGIIK